MTKEELIHNKEKELMEIRALHYDIAMMYGSELCAGEMLRKEEAIEREISLLKEGIYIKG